MKRILLKISWESLSSELWPIDPEKASTLADKIAGIQKTWVELVLVLGGGNIYRGSKLIAAGVDGADSHNMSMLSTVFNAVTLKNFLGKIWVSVVVMDALHVEFLEKYSAMKARDYISEGKTVIASSGGGTPFFTTDTTWVLRALETHCDCMVKLTKVDGVYDSDPIWNPNAQKFDTISPDEFISRNLKALDQTAIIMARDNGLPIYVMSIEDMEKIPLLSSWENMWTKIL